MTVILDEFGRPLEAVPAAPRSLRAKYDSAQTTTQGAEYWANTDGLSARLANSPAVRKLLRDRSRYEWANNCYAKGMIRTDADYVVGTGPRLQLLTDDDRYNRDVEARFAQWASQINLGRKLHTMRIAWTRDGEAFAQLVDNPNLPGQITLDLHLLEADQITDQTTSLSYDLNHDDGLTVDDRGNVLAFTVWPYHPGDYLTNQTRPQQPETVAARDMLHLYRHDRPGQLRGVPEITPALMLYPTLRKWTYAALGSAEKAARLAGVIKSTYTPDDPTAIEAMEAIYLEADTFLTLPEGWDISQVKAEQPSTSYEMFKREIIGEIARCLNMPYNIAAANSSRYNFASGKLDHLGWFKSVSIDQNQIGEDALEPTFSAWWFEASRLPNYLPPPPMAGDGVDLVDFRDRTPPHVWMFDGQDTIDPREASAKAQGLTYGFETLPRLWAKRGLDWEQELNAQAKALGLTVPELQEHIRRKLYGDAPQTPAEAAAAAALAALEGNESLYNEDPT